MSEQSKPNPSRAYFLRLNAHLAEAVEREAERLGGIPGSVVLRMIIAEKFGHESRAA